MHKVLPCEEYDWIIQIQMQVLCHLLSPALSICVLFSCLYLIAFLVFFPPSLSLYLSLPSLGSLLLCLSLFVFVSVCHCCMEEEHDGSISVLFTQPMSFPNCTAPATFAEAGDFHV